ncbi:iron ABC transporter permease [Uliginosibacterium sp. H3]|uniref:Iron ABC transporter permease n=1 Tax=Uliginosibacterium silvisoli TaxID=3114758 RepID=A0ABU6K1B8_9RHOO|nr:iron ABC transporter permease [Uliginosibacterium sp. H3]
MSSGVPAAATVHLAQSAAWLHLRRLPAGAVLAVLLGIGIFIAVQSGAVAVSAGDWLTPLWADASGSTPGGSYVLWNLRLPRAVFAILIGGTLGLSGALTQGLFRNPLADPSLLGVTSGAACAAALTIVVVSSMHLPLPAGWRIWLLPAAAFAGAFGVCLLLDYGSRWLTPGSIAGLLLTGMALNAIAVAVIGLCTYLANDEQLRTLSFWTLGSLAGARWPLVGIAAALLAFSLLALRRLTRSMNALALGEAAAAHVGVDVGKLRGRVVLLVALVCGFAVAWTGIIGFLGLIAPHMIRGWVGSDLRRLVPLSTLLGGLLLLVADTLARTVAIPAEIPVGIFTSLLGAPFFLLILRSASRRIG